MAQKETASNESRRQSPDIDLDEIKSTLDQDETEWIAPSWLNYSTTLPDHNHASTFANMDLRGRTMSGAHLMMADLKSVNAEGVSFANADLSFAEAARANFKRAIFTNADLCKVDFSNSDLSEAQLTGADLTQANLHAANLCGAKLRDACLDSCDLSDTLYDSYTELPFSDDEANRRGMHNVGMTGNQIKEPRRHL